MSSDLQEYEVERVVAMKRKNNCKTYKVKWVGYHQSENTWEPEEFLKNAREKIKEFELQMKKRKKCNKNNSIKSNDLSSKTQCSRKNDSLNTQICSLKRQAQKVCTTDENNPIEVINLLSDNSKCSDDEKSNKDHQQNTINQCKVLQKDQIIDKNLNEKVTEQNKQKRNSQKQNQNQPQDIFKQSTKKLTQKIERFSSRCINIKKVVKINQQTVVLFESKGKKYKSSIDIIKKYHAQDLQSFYDTQIIPIETNKIEKNDQK